MRQIVLIAEKKLPEFNWNLLIGSIAFWNDEGHGIFDRNIAGTLGSPRTQTAAKEEGLERFVLTNLAQDIAGTNSLPEGYKTGLSGSHIWVSRENNERVMMVCFH